MIRNQLDAPLTTKDKYLSFGRITENLPIRVLPGETAYIKAKKCLLGQVKVKGILTFTVEEYGAKLCIFFSNPYFGYNRFGLFWKRITKRIAWKNFNKLDMCSRWKSFGLIGWHSKKDETKRIEVSGFMSQDNNPAVLHVIVKNVDDKAVISE